MVPSFPDAFLRQANRLILADRPGPEKRVMQPLMATGRPGGELQPFSVQTGGTKCKWGPSEQKTDCVAQLRRSGGEQSRLRLNVLAVLEMCSTQLNETLTPAYFIGLLARLSAAPPLWLGLQAIVTFTGRYTLIMCSRIIAGKHNGEFRT